MLQVLGWDAVINAFYLPGTIVGLFFVDWLGPKVSPTHVVVQASTESFSSTA